ncbi:MAG: hypothetical protein AAFZ65_04715, partial [Planctomycetota bacterium]
GLNRTPETEAPRRRATPLYPADIQRAWLTVIVCAVGISSINLDWWRGADSPVWTGWMSAWAYLAAGCLALPIVARTFIGVSRSAFLVDLIAGIIAMLAPFYPVVIIDDGTPGGLLRGIGNEILAGSLLASFCGFAVAVIGASSLAARPNQVTKSGEQRA